MPTDALTLATENVLRAAEISPEEATELRAAANLPHLLPAGGYHPSTDIVSLDGLAGSYLWSEDPHNVRAITFTFDPISPGSAGTYTIRTATVVFEEGTFHCTPSGPTSPVALLFVQPAGGPQRIFIIAGAFIDDSSRIVIMILADFTIVGQIIPRFSAVRLA